MTHIPRLHVLTILLVTSFLPASSAFAQSERLILASATGSVVSVVPCPAYPIFCQESNISGRATRLGTFTGVLNEVVNVETGQYTGTAVFTFNGGTISTEYEGQIGPFNESGIALFFEDHEVTDGTGRFEGATGEMRVVGSFDMNTNELSIFAVAVLRQ